MFVQWSLGSGLRFLFMDDDYSGTISYQELEDFSVPISLSLFRGRVLEV